MAKSAGTTRTVGSRGNSTPSFNNDYKSSFGFQNVGALESRTSISGSYSSGTVKAEVSSVQQYLNTGKWDAYGNNQKAKEAIYKEVARDMKQRGYDVQYDSDLKRISNADNSVQIIVSKNSKTGKWEAKSGNAGLNTSDTSSMTATLREMSRKKR